MLFTILPYHFPSAEEPKISLSLCMEMYTNAHFLRSSVFLSCCIPKLQTNTQILRITIPPILQGQPVRGRLPVILLPSGSESKVTAKRSCAQSPGPEGIKLSRTIAKHCVPQESKSQGMGRQLHQLGTKGKRWREIPPSSGHCFSLLLVS